jgi:Family of unknown function (DUF5687)
VRDSFFVLNRMVCTLAIMVSTLLSHGWKKFTRSAAFTKEVTASIFLGLMAVMMIGYSLGLGFGLNAIITKALNQEDSYTFLNMLLLYYFVVEFIMRYMIQNVPVLDVQPYLHLPIRRSRIMHFLLIKSLAHVLNFMVLLLFTPFAFTVVAQRFGASGAWYWLLSIWAISLCMHYIVILFKKKLDDTLWGILAIVLIFSGLAAADYYQWFRLSDISAAIFLAASQYPVILIILASLGLLYFFNFRFFLEGVYADDQVIRKSAATKSQDISFLQNFGGIGDWINLEIKFILRNKRPRTVLLMTLLFMLYGLIFYTRDIFGNSTGMFLFAGLLMTGIFMMNYGQFLFSWQASHFDFTLTRPVSLRQYIESKYWLINTITLACFLLTIPYGLFGWHIILMHAAVTLFNMGVNIFIVLNMAMWGPKKLTLTKGGSLNYEGLGAAQWVMGIPIMASPYVLYLPFSLFGYPNIGLVAVGAVGLLGIILRRYFLTLTTNRLKKLKYSIAEGFRTE